MTGGQNITVEVDSRKFTVVFRDGKLWAIRERVLLHPGKPWACWSDQPRWHHAHNVLPKNPKALYARVAAEAISRREATR